MTRAPLLWRRCDGSIRRALRAGGRAAGAAELPGDVIAQQDRDSPAERRRAARRQRTQRRRCSMRLIGGVPESTALSTALVRVTSAACSGIGGVRRSERGVD